MSVIWLSEAKILVRRRCQFSTELFDDIRRYVAACEYHDNKPGTLRSNLDRLQLDLSRYVDGARNVGIQLF